MFSGSQQSSFAVESPYVPERPIKLDSPKVMVSIIQVCRAHHVRVRACPEKDRTRTSKTKAPKVAKADVLNVLPKVHPLHHSKRRRLRCSGVSWSIKTLAACSQDTIVIGQGIVGYDSRPSRR